MEWFGLSTLLEEQVKHLRKELVSYHGIDLSKVFKFKEDKEWKHNYKELLKIYDEINPKSVYIEDQKKDIKYIVHYLLSVAKQYKKARIDHDEVYEIYLEIHQILMDHKKLYGFERSLKYIEEIMLKNSVCS
jgi:hypothetical protein